MRDPYDLLLHFLFIRLTINLHTGTKLEVLLYAVGRYRGGAKIKKDVAGLQVLKLKATPLLIYFYIFGLYM